MTTMQASTAAAPDLTLVVMDDDPAVRDVVARCAVRAGFRAVRTIDSTSSIVLMAGTATIDGAVEAGQIGVRAYATRPIDCARLEALLTTIRAQAAAPHDESLASMERRRIGEVLRSVSGNKSAAARILGVSRRALYRRLERYGLSRHRS